MPAFSTENQQLASGNGNSLPAVQDSAPSGESFHSGAAPDGGGMASGGGNQDFSVRDWLAQKGWDASSFQTDDDFANYLGQVQQLQEVLPTYQRLAAVGQQFMPYADKFDAFQQWLAEQGQGGAATPATGHAPQGAEESPYWPQSPEWNPDWEKFLAVDAAGNVVLKPEYAGMMSPTLPQKYQEYRKWQQDRMNALLGDPWAAVKPAWEKDTRALVQEMVQQQINEYRQQQFANSFAVANQDWLYETDPQTGAPMRMNGRPVLSQIGQFYADQIQRLEQMGVGDPQQQAQLALEIVWPYLSQQQQQVAAAQAQQQPPAGQSASVPAGQAQVQVQNPAAQAAPAGLNPKDRFLGNNGFSPNREGTVSRTALPHVSQNDTADFRERAREMAKRKGLIQGE